MERLQTGALHTATLRIGLLNAADKNIVTVHGVAVSEQGLNCWKSHSTEKAK